MTALVDRPLCTEWRDEIGCPGGAPHVCVVTGCHVKHECLCGAQLEVCAFCGEARGWCQLTGGSHLCEGLGEYLDLVVEVAAAPVLFIRSGGSDVAR